MNVAVCDDDKIFLNSAEKKLAKYDCSVFLFDSVDRLIGSDATFDVVFMDIEFGGGKTGFDAARFLQRRGSDCVLSFFTNYVDYAVRGYNYQPFRYILKTEPEPIIDRQICETFEEYHRRNRTLSGMYNGYAFSVKIADVYYISSHNHIVTIYTKKGEFELYKQIRQLDDELNGTGFLRCHRSYIVNMSHVFVMRGDNFFIMDNEARTEIPIGVSYRANAKKRYLSSVR